MTYSPTITGLNTAHFECTGNDRSRQGTPLWECPRCHARRVMLSGGILHCPKCDADEATDRGQIGGID